MDDASPPRPWRYKDLITSMDDAIVPEEFLCGTEAGLRSRARVMQGVGFGKRETKTAETSSTCRS
jgi:hypothetical protein